jgi:plasmid stabilization system protein ParE
MSSSKRSPRELEVFLTDTAEVRLTEILAYVELHWGKRSKDKLLKIVLKGFKQVSVFPESGKGTQSVENILQIVLNKQTSFYYSIVENKIYILSVFDNRMEEKNRS